MKNLFLILMIVQLLFSCAVKKNIPEVTPFINAEELKEISLSPTIFSILSISDRIILPDQNGNIHSISPNDKKSSILVNIDSRLSNEIFVQNGFIALNTIKSKKMILLDPNEKKIVYKSKKGSWKKIIGVDKSHIIYLNKKTLKVLNYRNNSVIFSTKIDHKRVINCEFSDKKAYVLTKNSILIYDLMNGTKTRKIIKVSPVSPFLKISDCIFFGDSERNIVKYSLTKGKVIWKFKFQKQLLIRPLFFKGIIIASPEDNNTYFITHRGGLKHWYNTDFSRLFDPVLMKDNLAVFQRTEEGASILYLGITKHSVMKFKNKSIFLKFPPVYLDGKLYSIVSYNDDNSLKLIEIGNKFGAEIQAEPENNYETGKSIKFTIKSVNIEKPEIRVNIFDAAGTNIFVKEIPFDQPSSFVWVPETGGKFAINVNTRDEKGVVRTDIKDIFVTNIRQIYKKLQMKLHRQCDVEEQKTEQENEEDNKKLPD